MLHLPFWPYVIYTVTIVTVTIAVAFKICASGANVLAAM